MTADELRAYWDAHTQAWLDGDDELPEPLQRWWDGYRGRGLGAPTRACLAEPYVGPLDGSADLVVLGLSPGRAFAELQGRDGTYAQEIRDRGSSYSAWAAPNPYLGASWTDGHGPNRYHRARQAFAARWLGQESARVLTMELFPWHSRRVTGQMRPPSDVLHRMLWQPLDSLGHDLVFAFGRPWVAVCDGLDGLAEERTWKAGEPGFDSPVSSRVVRAYRRPGGGRVAVCWQAGYAGPPGPADTDRLRALLAL